MWRSPRPELWRARITAGRDVKIEVYPDQETVAGKAAAIIAAAGREAVTSHGRFIMAVSGGHTPWVMLRALCDEQLPWGHVHVVQVDERVAPAGDPDRNFTHLRASLLDHAPLLPDHIHAMPVEAPDLDRAAAQYTAMLRDLADSPPVLDLIHLGLGPDGHTASLVPGDPVLHVTDADVATTEPYQGRRRMTLTFPIINRSRFVLWLVTGRDKAAPLVRLRDGDQSIPAAHVRRDRALILADRAAAEQLGTNQKMEAQK
jgi:6-phosphogluconolactonase